MARHRHRYRHRLAAEALALAALLPLPPAAAEEGAPRRVVSLNVCTDQLAMLIAGEGQLHSVSYMAQLPEASMLHEEAARYPVNHGLAEEVFLMQPDLVLTGTFTTRATTALLRRLGFRIEEFPPETSFDDVRENMLRLGRLLGRDARAAELVAALDRGLAGGAAGATGKLVATYSANSYTSGGGSLAGAVIEAAGLKNLGARLGIAGAGYLSLESLVLANPDLVAVDGREYDAPALAVENFVHPAFRRVAGDTKLVNVPARSWLCGGPFNLEAVRILRAAAEGTGR